MAEPVFTYPGSKATLAPVICEILRAYPHDNYVEPFAGTLSVLLRKEPSRQEVVNDLANDVVNFFTQLRDHPDELIRRCMLTPFAREELARAHAEMPFTNDDLCERARLWWVRQVQSMNGTGGQTFRGWSLKNGKVVDFASRLADTAERLRMVTIENRDAVEVIQQYDGPRTVFYCDPPYAASTRGPGGLYEVEMLDDDLQRQLAKVLNDCVGIVVVSGYPSPLYDELYPSVDSGGKWDRHDINFKASMSTMSLKGKRGGRVRDSVERLWCNRPIPLSQRLSLFDLLPEDEMSYDAADV